MRDNKSCHWTQGLPIVQHQKNRKFHRGIQTSPYNALFGSEAFNGLEMVNGLSQQQKKGIKITKELFTIFGSSLFHKSVSTNCCQVREQKLRMVFYR